MLVCRGKGKIEQYGGVIVILTNRHESLKPMRTSVRWKLLLSIYHHSSERSEK